MPASSTASTTTTTAAGACSLEGLVGGQLIHWNTNLLRDKSLAPIELLLIALELNRTRLGLALPRGVRSDLNPGARTPILSGAFATSSIYRVCV
jgi:hypothetical protein